jgi:hypothetical protein
VPVAVAAKEDAARLAPPSLVAVAEEPLDVSLLDDDAEPTVA